MNILGTDNLYSFLTAYPNIILVWNILVCCWGLNWYLKPSDNQQALDAVLVDVFHNFLHALAWEGPDKKKKRKKGKTKETHKMPEIGRAHV